MELIDTLLLDQTTTQADASERHRMNHNFHRTVEDPVHRLLNAVEPESYIPVHRHLHPPKDEGLLVLRGRCVSYLFDARGAILRWEILDPLQGRFGVDIPAGEWHGVLSLERGTVLYEVKQGPFVPLSLEDRAPWSPDPQDLSEVMRFMQRLRAVL
ncbi:MAG: WbuC family cupin fold metalloprotein [Alistipes sp.]|nr:WbuC family cupin fold metalloprotein [Alistipes sp.]